MHRLTQVSPRSHQAITMPKVVKLKTNIIIYLAVLIVAGVLFSTRRVFLSKPVEIIESRRDIDAQMAGTNKRILGTVSSMPEMGRSQDRWNGNKKTGELPSKILGPDQFIHSPDRQAAQYKNPPLANGYNGEQIVKKADFGERLAKGVAGAIGPFLNMRKSTLPPGRLSGTRSTMGMPIVWTTQWNQAPGLVNQQQPRMQGQGMQGQGVQGQGMQGPGRQGTQMEGQSMQGQGAQGQGMQGPGMQGQGMQGSDVQGQGMQGSDVQGQGMQGPGMQGQGMQGPGMQGQGMQGPGMQGQGMQGSDVQGQGMQGPGMQGQGMQGLGVQGQDMQGQGNKGKAANDGWLARQGGEEVLSGNPLRNMKFYDGSGNLVVSQPNWIVVTSIQGPTSDIIILSNLPGWKLVVVADTKTPKDWSCPNAVFISVEQQEKLNLKILPYIPYKSYARKNIGYFFAITYGAKLIYDTDDDNKPNDGFRSFNLEDGDTSTVLIVKNFNKTYNPYPHFGQHTIWPRGFPLDEVSNSQPREYLLCEMTTPYIRQGVVNGDPDVDAIYRMLHKHTSKRLNVLFDEHAPRVALPAKVFAPMNSQNTISTYQVFWALAFPVTLNFRVCDIWRSYWSQRLLWLIGGQVGFYTAGTFQYRNAHSYLKDFIDEQKLYYQASSFVMFLDNWQCERQDFFGCITALSYDMAENGFWTKKDAQFVEAFQQDLLSVGYKPPQMQPVSVQSCKTRPSNVIFYPQEQLASYGVVPKYYLPPFAQDKFNTLANIVKENCPKTKAPVFGLSLNGSSLINDILLVIHLDGTPTTTLLSGLELFYRPRYGQILYCSKWQEQNKDIFHKMRASFAEIPEGIADPEIACLYKAAEMHYIVDGYLIIHQNALLNVDQLKHNRKSVWIPANWTSEGSCQGSSCMRDIINLNQANSVLGLEPSSGRLISGCEFYKRNAQITYNIARVLYIPSFYNVQLRKASRNSLHGLSLVGWLQCVNDQPVALQSAPDIAHVYQYTDYVQSFDFNDIQSLCPLLGYNP